MQKFLTGLVSSFQSMERGVVEAISASILSLSILITLIIGNWGWPAISLMVFAIVAVWTYVYRDYTWPIISDLLTKGINKFKDYTLDKQIAVVLSGISLIALAFASWTATFWWSLAATIAWAIVWWEEATKPAVKWVWNESEPPRKKFTGFVFGVLFGERGLSVVMIGWGVLAAIVYGLSFYMPMPSRLILLSGRVGFCGIIFGAIFHAIQKFHEGRIKAREAEALAKVKPKAKSRKKAIAKTATSP